MTTAININGRYSSVGITVLIIVNKIISKYEHRSFCQAVFLYHHMSIARVFTSIVFSKCWLRYTYVIMYKSIEMGGLSVQTIARSGNWKHFYLNVFSWYFISIYKSK
jgi:hypothetical protein